MAMEPPSLSNLPTELICATLSSLTSGEDLLSLILTQSRINESFRAAKNSILSAVAHNSLPHRLLADALITLRCLEARRTRKADRKSQSRIHFKALYRIIITANEDFPPQPQLPLAELTPFFHYQRGIESFVQDYASRHILKYGGPALTAIELYRLRRALYRYDTFQTTSYFASLMRESDRDTLVWPTLLNEYAPSPWEVEEVVCVHQYLVERLEAVFDQVEEEFIQSVIATTKELATLGGGLDATRWYSEGVAKWCKDHPSRFFEMEDEDESGDDRTFFWTAQKESHRFVAEHLANSGILFLRHLFNTSDEKSRRELVTQDYGTYLYPLAEALSTSANPFKQKPDFEDNRVLTFEGDIPDEHSLGWLWVHQYRPTPEYALPGDGEFRSWGYVFWDRARLEYLNVVTEPCPQVGKYLSPPEQRRRGAEKSVEERLGEMGFIEQRGKYWI